MAFLSDSCTFHELTDDILAVCHPFSCGNEDLDDFFAHDATRYAHFLMGKTYCFLSTSLLSLCASADMATRATSAVMMVFLFIDLY